MIGALQTVDESLGQRSSALLQASHIAPLKVVITSLINEISEYESEFVLAFDDYHVIHEHSIHEAMTFLIERLPPHAHALITTRSDPPFPLSRLRARNELKELRATSLRFSEIEAATFLNGVMNLDLLAEDISALKERTEGWITGLHLSALSLKGRENKSGFIREFAGDNRLILEYLLEEVLNLESEQVQNFLLRTSILTRLNGSLCDALTHDESGHKTLEYLYHSNLFVVPLDDKDDWFRYHHLFADLLRLKLKQQRPEEFARLQITASQWCEESGLVEEAINYALAAKDWERALNLLEPIVIENSVRKNLPLWEQRQVQVPDEMVSKRPILCLWNASAYIYKGNVDLATKYLAFAESAAANDEGNFVKSFAASLRALLAFGSGDQAKLEEYSKKAVAAASPNEPIAYIVAVEVQAYSFYRAGELEEVEASLLNTIPLAKEAESLVLELWSRDFVGMAQIAMGKLAEAAETVRAILQYDKHDFAPQMLSAYAILAKLEYEWNNLEKSREYLDLSLSIHHEMGDKVYWVKIFETLQLLAPLVWFHAEKNAALQMIDFETERLQSYGNLPGASQARALKAGLLLRQGNLEAVRRWADSCSFGTNDQITYQSELPYMTFARWLIATGKPEQALPLLSSLQETASKGSRRRTVIEVLILKSLAQKACENEEEALEILQEALQLGEPENFIRSFVDEGEPLAKLLLLALKKHGKNWEAKRPEILRYVLKLNEAFGVAVPVQKTRVEPDGSKRPWWYLNDPLSERELEVIQLVSQGLSNQEIGNRLFISAGTVKRHISNIYQKLDVHSRTQASERARNFKLLNLKS
ncbi:MAG: hypothetical protein IPL32_00175 [Chloracidobacterium sp.]|nr:hypothetical protein [Chloracidobacterium sp.]